VIELWFVTFTVFPDFQGNGEYCILHDFVYFGELSVRDFEFNSGAGAVFLIPFLNLFRERGKTVQSHKMMLEL